MPVIYVNIKSSPARLDSFYWGICEEKLNDIKTITQFNQLFRVLRQNLFELTVNN